MGRALPSRPWCATSLIALAAGLVLPSAARADSNTSSIPFTPNYETLDANNVNLINGSFSISQKTVSIGPEDRPLYHERRNIEGGGIGWDNYSGRIQITANPDYSRFYVIDTREGTYSFVETNGVTYNPMDTFTLASDSKLSYNSNTHLYILTTGNGVKYYLTDAADNSLEKIEYPDGYTINIITKKATYKPNPTQTNTARRIQSVYDNRGYMLKYGYAENLVNSTTNLDPAAVDPNSITAVNIAIDYCNPSADSCSFTQAWPSATFNGGNITDPEGRTTSYYNDTAGFNIKRPGDTSPTITYKRGTDSTYIFLPTVITVTRDAKVWNYDFAPEPGMLDPDGYPIPRFATMTVTAPDTAQTVVYSTQTFSKPLTITDPLGRVTSIEYGLGNAAAAPTKVTAADSSYITYEYAAGGTTPTKETYVAKPGSGLANIVIERSLANQCLGGTSCKSVVWEKNARGDQTDYTYNSLGQVVNVTRPSVGGVRPQKRHSYTPLQAYYKNSIGSVVASGASISMNTGLSECASLSSCVNGSDEVRATISYGPQTTGTANNLLPVVLTSASGDGALSVSTTTTYDAIGNPVLVDGPLSGSADTIKTRYNAARQVVGIIRPDPDGGGALNHPATRISYTPRGEVQSEELGIVTDQSDGAWSAFTAQSATTRTYGLRGELTKETQSAGGTTLAVTQHSYDDVGRRICSAVRMNSAVFASLPGSACTLGTQGSLGADRITRNAYDLAGQLVQIKKGVGTTLEQSYATYSYTPTGKQRYVIDANGNRAELEYDGFSRLSKWWFPSTTKPTSFNPATAATALSTAGAVSTTDYEQYGYDSDGNRTSLRKRDGRTINFTYDALNRNTLKDIPGTTADDVYYGYDNRGLQLWARFGSTSGAGLTNAYDALGRLTSSSMTMDSVTRALSYQYDAHGNRTRVTHPDATYFSYSYDGLDRPLNVKLNGGTTIAAYSYDNNARRATHARPGSATATYGYDGLSRLTSVVHDMAGTSGDITYGFSYNHASQIISRSRSNGAYVFGQEVNVNRNYATNGLNQYTSAGPLNMAYDANGNLTSDGNMTLGYDVENRLVSAAGSRTAALKYDPSGRLYETSGGSAGVTRFLYDGDELVAEYDASGSMIRRYAHGVGIDDPLVWYEGAGTSVPTYLTTDHQGSITAQTDASGSPSTINSYNEWGIPRTTNRGRFGYTGQAWIPELRMWHHKARAYSPTLGRFLQTDPVGYDDQINLYAYAQNDPVNGTDPDGQRTILRNGQIYIIPERANTPAVRLPNNVGAQGVSTSDRFFHTYEVNTSSRSKDRIAVGNAIQGQPTPGPNNGAATPSGTINNAGYIPMTGSNNFVRSFSIKSPNSNKYTDITVNYTISGHHGLTEGFVMRYGEIGKNGAINIKTYGEGNAWKQAPILDGIWGPQVDKTWKGVDQIVNDTVCNSQNKGSCPQ